MDRASYNMAIIIQQDATEYSLFKSVNCSTCFGWYFTHHQELMTLYLQYLALMRPLLLPVTTGSSNGLINASLFKSVNFSTCFEWYFTHHQELMTLYLQYLALMRPLLLPVTTGSSNGLINASLFKSVNCSTCFGWYLTHHQEPMTLYLQYLALMRPLLLPVVTGSSNSLINARYCRYSVMSS